MPAFNISDWAMFQGIVEISEETDAPLIVGIHPDEVRHIGREMITGIIERAHRSSVPIAIHWDHGATYEQILEAIQFGFTSVMIDGSLKPFEENVAISKKVADSAHALGVSVEAELGTIGANDSYAEARRRRDHLHRPATTRSPSSSRPAWTASPWRSAPTTASTRPT